MDILFYLLVVGLGIAAAPNSDYDDYDYSAEEPAYEAPAEEPESALMPEAPTEEPAEEPEMPGAVAPMPPPSTPKTVPGFAPRQPAQVAGQPEEQAPEAPLAPGEIPADDMAAGWTAEDQTATGRMVTASEVRPILTVTKGSWIAVREWDGNDLLYFTNLLAWRCGLHEIRYAVNGGPEQVLEAEPCYTEEGAPNALKVEGILPYVVLPLGSVQSVTVRVLYDDLSVDSVDYDRQAVQIH